MIVNNRTDKFDRLPMRQVLLIWANPAAVRPSIQHTQQRQTRNVVLHSQRRVCSLHQHPEMQLRSQRVITTAASEPSGSQRTERKERHPHMERGDKPAKLSRRGSSGKPKRRQLRVAGLEVSPELIAIALGATHLQGQAAGAKLAWRYC